MPYVPPEVKERLKREVSIQRLAEARGIKLTRSGKELIGLCPFHDDRNPSLNIDPVKNVWSCKGACGEGGDVILWVMRAEGVSFHHALELLQRDYAPSAGPVVKIATVPKLPPLIDATADDKKLLGTVVDYYHRTLKDCRRRRSGISSSAASNPVRSSTVSSWVTPTARCACICRRRTVAGDAHPSFSKSSRGHNAGGAPSFVFF